MTDRTLNLGTKFSADTGPLLAGLAKIRKSLKAYAQQSATVGTQTTKLNKGLAGVGAAGTKATAPTKRLAMANAVLGKQISKVSGGFERLKAAMKVTASYGVAATMIFAFTKSLRFGADEIINFDQGLKNLEAITGASNAQLAAMSEVMLELARDTKFSATEISTGMVLLGQAGFTAEESLNAIKATSMLATGTLTSMQTTADLLTTTIRAFNLESIEAGRVADVFANAVNKSKLTVDKLRVAFNFVGAAASQAGLTLEQTAAATMVLANSGLRASTIGTGLRQMLAKLIAPSEKLRESFAAHGIDLSIVNSEGFNFRKTLEYLAPILIDTKTKTVDMAKAFELFKLRGAQAAAILIRGFMTGQFDEAIQKVNEVGTAAEMAAIQQEGLAVKFKNLSDSAGALAQALGEAGVRGAMGIFIDTMKALITVVERFVRSGFGIVTLQTVALTGAIVGLTKAIGFLEAVALTRLLRKLHLLTVITGASALRSSIGLLIKSIGGWNLVLVGVAAAVSLMVAILHRFRGAAKRSAEDHDLLATKANENVQILHLYGEVLDKLHSKKDRDSAASYLSTVKRLAEEYKELGSATQIMAMGHEAFMERRKAFHKDEFAQGLNESVATAIEYNDIMEDLIDTHSKLNRLGTSGFRQTNEDTEQLNALKKRRTEEAKQMATVIAATETRNEAEKKAIDFMTEGLRQGGLNKKQVEEKLKLMEAEGALTKTAVAQLTEIYDALANINEQYKEFAKIAGTEKMADEFKAIYDQLTTAAKIDFLKDAKSLQSKIASLTKIMKDFSLSSEEAAELTDLLTEAFLKLQRAATVGSLVTPRSDQNLEYAGGGSGGPGGRRPGGGEGAAIEEAEAELLRREKAVEKKKKDAIKAADDLKRERKRTLPSRIESELADTFDAVDLFEENMRTFQSAEINKGLVDFFKDLEAGKALTTLERMSPEIREIYDGLSDVQKMEFVKEFLSLENSIEASTDQMEALGWTSAKVQAVIGQMTRDFATLRTQNAWGGMALGLRDYTEEIKYSAQTWRDFTVDSLSGMEGAWSGFFNDVLNDADSFSDMLEKLWDRMNAALIDSFADALAQMAMKAGIAGFEALLGGVSTGPGYGYLPGGGQTAGFKAAGGPVSAGKAYIVGEKGKELFVPNDDGRILPNGRGGGGEASVSVVVNNNSAEKATVTETRGPDNSRQVFVTIGTDIARGGPIAGAIERTYGLRRKGRIV